MFRHKREGRGPGSRLRSQVLLAIPIGSMRELFAHSRKRLARLRENQRNRDQSRDDTAFGDLLRDLTPSPCVVQITFGNQYRLANILDGNGCRRDLIRVRLTACIVRYGKPRRALVSKTLILLVLTGCRRGELLAMR